MSAEERTGCVEYRWPSTDARIDIAAHLGGLEQGIHRQGTGFGDSDLDYK